MITTQTPTTHVVVRGLPEAPLVIGRPVGGSIDRDHPVIPILSPFVQRVTHFRSFPSCTSNVVRLLRGNRGCTRSELLSPGRPRNICQVEHCRIDPNSSELSRDLARAPCQMRREIMKVAACTLGEACQGRPSSLTPTADTNRGGRGRSTANVDGPLAEVRNGLIEVHDPT